MRRDHLIIGIGTLALLGLWPVNSPGARSAGKVKPSSAQEKVLYSFTGGSDGANPMSDLVLDSAGNLYGTTSQGGVGCNGYGCGTVFELKRTQNGWEEETLYSFKGTGSDLYDGAGPQAGMIFDSSGNLYGTTQYGGKFSVGTVFKLTPHGKGGWTESILYNFEVGVYPVSDLAFDAHGNIYSTTLRGGMANCFMGTTCGTVFELIQQSDGSWTGSTLHEFGGSGDGAIPSTGVVIDSSGSLYGMTVSGGSGQCHQNFNPGCGIAYKLTRDDKGKWVEKVLYNFARGNGLAVSPSAGLLVDGDGDRLLGTTQGGGDGFGTVFALRESKDGRWQQDVLHRFYESQDGGYPAGHLATDANGNLFGVTWAAGGVTNSGAGNGMVFELTPTTSGPWKETIVFAFTGYPDAWRPQAGVVLDRAGHIYGTTQFGGTGTLCGEGGCGTVYEITP